MQELVPIGLGLLLGAGAVRLHPRPRLPVSIALAVALGCLATIATGEAAVSWGFVLVDVPLVLLAAAVGGAVTEAWRRSAARA